MLMLLKKAWSKTKEQLPYHVKKVKEHIHSRFKRGFTLIELLVVISIISILSVVGVATYTGVRSKAEEAARLAKASELAKTLEASYVAGVGYQELPAEIEAQLFDSAKMIKEVTVGGGFKICTALGSNDKSVCQTSTPDPSKCRCTSSSLESYVPGPSTPFAPPSASPAASSSPTASSSPASSSSPVILPSPSVIPSSSPAIGPCNPLAIVPPQDSEWTISVGPDERKFKVHYPTSYNKTPTSIVFNFHGSGWGAYTVVAPWPVSHESYTYMSSVADEKGFIVVYPQALSPLTWNAGNRWIGTENDMGFVDAMLTDIPTKLCIDSNKVFAAGYSAGGMLAYRLACERGDKFAGIGAVSAVKAQDICNTPGVPLMHIHYIGDNVVPFGGGGLQSLPKVWDDSVAPFYIANQCTGSGTPPIYSTPAAQDSILCYNYSPCAKGEVELCLINNPTVSHTWPKGIGVPGYTTQYLDASRRLLDFFSRQSKP